MKLRSLSPRSTCSHFGLLIVSLLLAAFCTSSAFAVPTVTAVAPAAGSANVAAVSPVTAQFSEQLNPATITSDSFTVVQNIRVSGIAGGGTHSVAITNDGTVAVWGGNGAGQGTVPQGLTGVIQVAAGYDHTVALKNDGTVVVWGGFSGQSTVPAGLSGVVKIAASGSHTVALKSDGTVVAWGTVVNGTAYVPETVPAGLTGVVAVAAGSNHSLALKSDGTVVAWGYNFYGQATVPSGLTGVVAVAAGDSHSVALKADGTVVAWGYNALNQATVPAGLSTVTAIAASAYHTVALKADGTVVAWGQVSTGSAYAADVVPAGLTGVTAIAAGYQHTMALKSDGTMVMWGNNDYGQAAYPASLTGVMAISAGFYHTVAVTAPGTVTAWGCNSSSQSKVPAGLTGVMAVGGGAAHTVALKSDGTVNAWGSNANGETNVPVGLTGVTAIAVGSQHTIALKSNGAIVAWGAGNAGQTVIPAGLTNVTAVAAGGDHSVALKADGTVVAWGFNMFGETTVPAGLSGVVAVAAGVYHTVALKADGTVVAWGYNGMGQTSVPAGLSSVVAIAAGGFHTVALKADGTIVIWGDNSSGQSAPPVGLGGVIAISAGAAHTVVLKADGSVAAWGMNNYGQTNVPASPLERPLPGTVIWNAATLTATYQPTAPLPGGSTVKATITQGIRNLAGIRPSADVSWSFTISSAASYFTISTGTTGSGSLSCTPATPILNDTVTCMAAPATGYRLSDLRDNGVSVLGQVTAGSYTITPITGNHSLIATFSPNTYSLGIVTSGNGSGTVHSSPSPDIACSGACGSSYPIATTVVLTASPSPGSQFTGWGGDCSGTAECRLTMTANHNVSAAFAVPTYAITLTAGSGGTITGPTVVTKGDSPQYTFTPAPGYSVAAAYLDGQVVEGAIGGLIIPSVSAPHTLTVTFEARGFAVLVQGNIPSDVMGAVAYARTIGRIEQKLRARGIPAENIKSLKGSNTFRKSDVQTAIQTWARDKLNGAPAPLYIVMVDHGSIDSFYLGTETITPSDVNGWLTALEGALTPEAQAQPRVIVIGACNSGSFIPAVSKAGRVVITSGTAAEETNRGPTEPDTIRGGEFFVDELFIYLQRGYSLKESFDAATADTELYLPDSAYINGRPPVKTPAGVPHNIFHDSARQHPLLDDDGDGVGSNELQDLSGDGLRAGSIYLGTRTTYNPLSPGNLSDILATTETMFLGSDTTTAVIGVTLNDSLTGRTSQGVSLSGTMIVSPQNSAAQKTITLGPSGMATYFSFSFDSNGAISPVHASNIYRDKAGNQPPSRVTLTAPADGSLQKTALVFDWQDASDTDNDLITYTLIIAADSSFGSVVHTRELIPHSRYAVTRNAKLRNDTTYYWKVVAVDSFGQRTESDPRSFTTDPAGDVPVIVEGRVTSRNSSLPVAGATVATSQGIAAVAELDGYYALALPAGVTTLAVASPVHAPESRVVTLPGQAAVKINISLTDVVTRTLTVTNTNSAWLTTYPPMTLSAPQQTIAYHQGARVYLESGYARWSGACNGERTSCFLTMDTDKAVTVTGGFSPSATTFAATTVTDTSAVLQAGVQLNNLETTAQFLISDATGGSFQSPLLSAGNPLTFGTQPVSYIVTGLKPGTKYSYIVQVKNSAGSAYGGSYVSFTTLMSYPLSVTVSGSGTVKSSPAGIDTTSQGSKNFAPGTVVNLTATANTGYTFTGWTGACSGTGACSVTMGAAATVGATFTINSYTVTISPGANGAITGPTTVTYGDTPTYSVTPATGYHVSDVVVDGQSVGPVTSYTFGSVTANHTISATFAIDTLTVTLSAGANGSLSGPTVVNYGDIPTYTITPATGYHVADVTVNGVSVGAVSSYTFPTGITATTTVSATFAITTYPITLTAGGGGTITGPTTVNHGGMPTYTITPDNGYHVTGVRIGATNVGAVTSYTFTTPVNGPVTIVASFAINIYAVNVTSGAGGTVTGPVSVQHGTSALYTVTPYNGYHLVDVVIDGVSVGPLGSYTFTSVTRSHTISASFGLNTYTVTLDAAPGGSISGPAQVQHGENPTYAIVPDTGYSVTDVLINGVSAGPIARYTFPQGTGVTTGTSHTLLLKSDGTVWSWGSNFSGQLGNGATVNSPMPVPVTGLTDVIAVAGGGVHSVALKKDGTVWAWGQNNYGQVGDGTTTNRLVPVPVSGLTGVISISAGEYHSVALKSDGTVWAWGHNSGQLGTGVMGNSLTPVQMAVLTDITAVAAGKAHTVALKRDGTVWACGYNYYGEVGSGTNSVTLIPVQVPNLTEVTAVDAGQYISMALKSDGSVWTWGSNYDGELGNGSTAYSYIPLKVPGLGIVKAISAGAYHTMVVLNDGTVRTWGNNLNGQLGNGTTAASLTPVQVNGLSGVTSLDGGGWYSTALKEDGTVWTWGQNTVGQLGTGTTTGSTVPNRSIVSGITADTTISARFTINTFTITAATDGMGTVSGPATATYGGTAVYAITPNTGYQVAQVKIDGISVGAVTSYTFTTVTASHTISASFVPALAIATTTLPGGTVGAAYSQSLMTTGGVAPVTWTLAGGALPAGLALSSTGIISGVPTTAGSASFTVSASDSTTVSASMTFNITIAPAVARPDLVITSLSASSTTLIRGKTKYTFTATVRNQGTATAMASTLNFAFSTDTVITPADILVGTVNVPTLAAGTSRTVTLKTTIPASVPAASYYLGAYADPRNTVAEANEVNNSLTGSTKYTAK